MPTMRLVQWSMNINNKLQKLLKRTMMGVLMGERENMDSLIIVNHS